MYKVFTSQNTEDTVNPCEAQYKRLFVHFVFYLSTQLKEIIMVIINHMKL